MLYCSFRCFLLFPFTFFLGSNIFLWILFSILVYSLNSETLLCLLSNVFIIWLSLRANRDCKFYIFASINREMLLYKRAKLLQDSIIGWYIHLAIEVSVVNAEVPNRVVSNHLEERRREKREYVVWLLLQNMYDEKGMYC